MTAAQPWAALDAEDADRHRRLTAPDALANAAAWYAAQGVPIFPLRVGGKSPLIGRAHPDDQSLQSECKRACGRDGHGLYDATTDPERVAAWWKATPRANIGMRTGILADVIDIDPPEGWRSWAALRHVGCHDECHDPACTGGIPPILGTVITPRTGAHFYIRPTGDGNATDFNDWPNIDYRGDGGFVVLPPSYSAEHGRHWLWSTPIDVAALKGGE